MTREEAIVDIRDNIKPVVGGKSLDMAIEALKQEPALDKIRAEVIEKAKGTMNDTRAEGLYMALQIIDKYRGES